MAGLRLEHIYKVYPNGTKAVSDFTMDIKDKEFIVFVGPSGCGKSTTLRMIAGLEEISTGELYIDDNIVNEVEPKDRDIAMVFQNYALYPHMSVYENIAFGLKLRHVPNEEIHKKVLWAAKVLDLTEYLDRKPKQMSGGQRQRVSLGRAIIRNPKVMLLDEPLSNLDAKLRSQMRNEIAKLHEQLQTTFIYVTHDQVEAMTLGTRVVVMKLGKIMQIDTPKNLYDYPDNMFVAGFIGTPQMNFFDVKLQRNKKYDIIKFNYNSNTFRVNKNILSKIAPKYFNLEVDVVIGIRSEDLSLDPNIISKSDYLINIKISHFEELGNETIIYAELFNELNFESNDKRKLIAIKGSSTYDLKRGDITQVAINIDKIHIFDKETEQKINPIVPKYNYIRGRVVNNYLYFSNMSFEIPKTINLKNGEYDVVIPVESLILNNETGQKINTKNVNIKYINNKSNILEIEINNEIIYGCTDLNSFDDKNILYVKIDYTKIDFYKNNELIIKALNEYDKIDAVFLNYISAKEYINNKYDDYLNQRIENVNIKYQSIFEKLKKDYETKMNRLEINDKDNHRDLVTSDKNKYRRLKEKSKEERESINQEYKKEIKNLNNTYKKNKKTIIEEISKKYEKIYNNEIDSLNLFKEINKDKDAYTKRMRSFNDFRKNNKLEKDNEINKRINSLILDYNTKLNELKEIYKRKSNEIKDTLKKSKKQIYQLIYPEKEIKKEYRSNLIKYRKEYGEELVKAKLLFFLKTNELLTLCSDDISGKMIQGLGIKVFSKEYLLEIPHDAYNISEDGFKVKVIEVLDYGDTKYAKCLYKGNGYQNNESVIYVKLNDIVNDINLNQSELTLSYDVNKIHIIEKSISIKIY